MYLDEAAVGGAIGGVGRWDNLAIHFYYVGATVCKYKLSPQKHQQEFNG